MVKFHVPVNMTDDDCDRLASHAQEQPHSIYVTSCPNDNLSCPFMKNITQLNLQLNLFERDTAVLEASIN